MHTAGVLTQGKPNTDAQLFFSADDIAVPNATHVAAGTSGLIGWLVAASSTSVWQKQISGLLLRTGILQSTNYATNLGQQAFGTANGPGPSAVAGTSGPSGFGPNAVMAPVTKANMPTLVGSVAGAPKKGVQINTIDVLYQIQGGAATTVSVGLVTANPAAPGNDVAIATAVLIAATNLSVAVNSTNAKIHRQRLTNANPQMLVTDGTIVAIDGQIINPAGVTTNILGFILGCSYNYN